MVEKCIFSAPRSAGKAHFDLFWNVGDVDSEVEAVAAGCLECHFGKLFQSVRRRAGGASPSG